MSQVIFGWPISSRFGWGIRGLNFALHWDGIAVSAMPDDFAELPPGDPRQPLLAERLEQGRRFRDQILATSAEVVQIDAPVLVALGNDLTAGSVGYGRMIRGKPTIACAVFEDVESVERNVGRLKAYDAVVVASNWNKEVIAGLGVRATVCHEAVDTIIFNPSVRVKRDDGRFRVFSGGKVEWRKGQDLVLQAFKVFADRHDDAVLVACWDSPFPHLAAEFEGKWEHGAPPGYHIGKPNYHAWVSNVGIDLRQFEYVEPRANWRMAEVYGGCDCALFLNRVEGGTSFPTMETIASGVPTIYRAAYGLSDLETAGIRLSAAFDIEESIQSLEARYASPYHNTPNLAVPQPGSHNPALPEQTIEFASYWNWKRHCNGIVDIIGSI